MMRKTIAILILAVCLLVIVPALAANVFRFTDQAVTVYVGESVQPAIEQDGRFAEGTLAFKSLNTKLFTVDESGTVTGVAPGIANLQAELLQDGKTIGKTAVRVTVSRRVTKVTLDTRNLQVYEPYDAKITPLLKQYTGIERVQDETDPEENEEAEAGETEEQEEIRTADRILVLAAGKGFRAVVAVTPDNVSYQDKKVTLESSDVGVVKIAGMQVTAIQPGECQLTITSVQNPEVTERFHVLVTQPAKRIQINAPTKTVSAGGTLQLSTVFTPDNATIQNAIWTSKNEKVAVVDENGVVTGVARGNVTIEAAAADGSGARAQIVLTVTQGVTGITIKEDSVRVATGRRSSQLHVTILPSNANNRRIVWSSSDESIATVRNGTVTGVKAGDCYVTCTSESDPGVSATIPVHIVQLMTRITVLNQKGLSFNVGETAQLEWEVFPENATDKEVTFTSRAPKVAAVDANGIVTGLSKGQANIELHAADGSNVRAVFRVNVIQPVTGIESMKDHYYAQLNDYRRISNFTRVLPRNANNQRIWWTSSNPQIASIHNNRSAYGHRRGEVILTATTDDGGFTASTTLIVDDFDRMIRVDKPRITDDNKIKLSFGNTSPEYIVNKIYFRIRCFDTMREPMICNEDGKSTYFDGTYPLELYPGEWTRHGQFKFGKYKNTGLLGYITVTITGYDFDNGQHWSLSEEKQVEYAIRSDDSKFIEEPTPEPVGSDKTGGGNG